MSENKENELAGDPKKGAIIFKQHCAGCHPISKNMMHKFGPNLYGLWGREASTVRDFKFKKGFNEVQDKKIGTVWGDFSLLLYLTKIHIPGTKMKFRDLDGKDQEKADLIAYLKKETDPKKK